MALSKAVMAVIVILIVVVAGFAIYAGLTYPRTTLTIPVSFSIGADSNTEAFDQPFLADKIQVQVTVTNGAALWRAQITSQDQVVWEHAAGQIDQMSYTSEWIQLSSGSYNITFQTVGAGSLDATVTVTSKGGFW